jgi:hypothetical protein
VLKTLKNLDSALELSQLLLEIYKEVFGIFTAIMFKQDVGIWLNLGHRICSGSDALYVGTYRGSIYQHEADRCHEATVASNHYI